MTTTRDLKCAVIVTAIIVGSLVAIPAYYAGRASHQNVNDLISVGWNIADPEGYTVERFDEGLMVLAPSYWTAQPIEEVQQ